MFDTIPTGTLIRLTRPTEYRNGEARTPLAAGTMGETLYALAGGYVCRFDVADPAPGAGEKFIPAAALTPA